MSEQLPLNSSSPREVEVRVGELTQGADLGRVAASLAEQRDEILGRWMAADSAQPFHAGRPFGAVADNIPELFDALVALMQRSAPPALTPGPPLDDPGVLNAARAHANRRFEQGLEATAIVAEFRLLRQEIGRALRVHLPSDVPADDLVGAELLVHDALDGAIALALSALTQQVEELREEFVATLVHDLRQPITTIKGHLQLVLRRLEAPAPDLERAADLLGRAEAEANRLGRLVDQLSEASRVALGRLDVRIERADLRELLEAAVGRLAPVSASRVQLELYPADLDLHGEFDAELVERVIENLLSNAYKYSPPDSPIQISVSEEEVGLHLRVRDYGIGLDSDEIASLFQRYGRASGAVEQGVEGLGLGLYLSKGIIDAHGGRIWAESGGKGQGTTLHVVLPRR